MNRAPLDQAPDSRRAHREVSELLPWYVNDTLEGSDLERVSAHLESCESCRAELAREQSLAHALRTSEELAYSPERALDRLRETLPDDEAEEVPDLPAGRTRWLESFRGLATPLRWAFVAQLAIIAALSVALLRSSEPDAAPYRTLSSPSEVHTSGAPSLRIVFMDTASEGDIRGLLIESGCHIVSGPSRFGVYTIEAPRGGVESTLEELRSSDLVIFAEPGAAAP